MVHFPVAPLRGWLSELWGDQIPLGVVFLSSPSLLRLLIIVDENHVA